jgi:hypothetical protein
VEGDDHGEAYTASVRDVGLSHEIGLFAGAEAVKDVEGNMSGAAIRRAGMIFRQAGMIGGECLVNHEALCRGRCRRRAPVGLFGKCEYASQTSQTVTPKQPLGMGGWYESDLPRVALEFSGSWEFGGAWSRLLTQRWCGPDRRP